MVGMEIASLFARVGADVTDFSKGMAKVKEDMSFAEKGMSGLQTAAGVGLKAALGVGIAAVGGLTAGIGVSVKAAMDMEQGIADIGAMMALTTEDTATLQDHIMDLGLDPKLKVSATEAAGAVMALGTAGLDMTEIMGGASKATVLLANATGLKGNEGFASAANIATDVMAQFNIEATDMDKAVSAIAGTTVASKFTIDDYRLALAQAGGVAGSVGVDFEDFNAVIAATSPSFASGSDAGTSFKTFLQRLVPQTDKAKEALIQLGLSTGEDVVTAFFDASGAMRPMEEIAGNLKKAFGGLSEAQKIEAASTIFGTDAMRTALALAEGGDEIIREMKKAIGNVDAEELARKRMDTLAGSWEIFQGVMETLTLGLGQKFIPVVRSVVDWITGLAQKYGPQVIDMFGAFAQRITDFIPLLGKVNVLYEDGSGLLAELTEIFGFSEDAAQNFWMAVWDVKQTVDNFIDSVTATFRPIAEAIANFVDWQDVLTAVAFVVASVVIPAIGAFVAATGPAIAIFASLVAASALMRSAWEGDWLGIRTMTGNAVAYLTQTFGGLVSTIREFGGQALQEIVAWATGNQTQFAAVNAIWESARSTFVNVFSAIGTKLQEWGATVWAEFKERFPNAAGALQDAFAAISTKFQELWAVISPLINAVVKAMQDMAAKWNDSTLDMSSALGIAKTVIDGIWKMMITLVSTSVGVMIDTLKLVAQLLTGDWAGAWNTAKGIVHDVLEGLKTAVRTAFETVMQIFGVNIQDLTRWRDEFVNRVTEARDSAVNRLQEMRDNVIRVVQDFVNQTRNNIEQWRNNLVQKFQEIASNVRERMEEAKRNIVDPIASAIDATVTLVSGWWRELTNMFGELRNDILEYMAGVKTNIIEPVKAFIADTSDKITGWLNWIVDRWQALKDAAQQKWDAIKMAVVEPVRELVQAVMDKVTSWKDWIVNKFQEIWEAVKRVLDPQFWLNLGRDMIQGLWDGIKNAWNSFTSWLNNAWESIKDTVNQVFQRHSPSQWFVGLGSDMMLGLRYGVEDGVSGVTGAFNVLSGSINNSMSAIVSTVGTQLNSTMQSVIEGVRYGANMVNLATADVLRQSQEAERIARANWEKLKAEMAKPLPPPPPPVINPNEDTNAPPPVTVPPIILPPIVVPPPPPSMIFNDKNLGDALTDALGTTDIGLQFTDLRVFANTLAGTVDNAILAGKLSEDQLSSQEVMARTYLHDPEDYNIGKVLDAIQTLIATIIARGLGNNLSFDITEAPGNVANNRTELTLLIQYLAAQYGT